MLNRYFTKFIDELNFLLENKIVIDGEEFSLKVMCFVCDRPARAFVKNIVPHNAFYAFYDVYKKGSVLKEEQFLLL